MIGASARPVLRLARRNLWRDRWRSALIVLLIALPIAGMTVAALLVDAAMPTPQERATGRMGRADLIVWPAGDVADARPADLTAVLPPGSVLEPMVTATDDAVLPGTSVELRVWSVWPGGLSEGRAGLVEGRAPADASEVALSRRAQERLHATLGDTVPLQALGPRTIVGTIEIPEALTSEVAVVTDASGARDPSLEWLVGLPPGADPDSVLEDVECIGAVDGDCGERYRALDRAAAGEASSSWWALVFGFGSLLLVEAALIASAAFAVGIRRRMREFGLLGAAGATPRQMAAILLAEGLTAGVAAAVIGILAGVLIAFVVGSGLDGLVDRRAGPVGLDPAALLLAAVIGVGAAMLAAAVPAWSAARLPTLTALSGRRPPSAPARRLLRFGLVLVAIAVTCTVVAPLILRGERDAMPPVLIVVGAIAGLVGFGACSPWLLERLEGPARHLPLAARIAVRDTARARTRNGAIVTAVLASVAGMIALASLLAAATAYNEAHWYPPVPADVVLVQGDAAGTLGPRVADALGAVHHGSDLDPLVDGSAGHLELLLTRGPSDGEPASDRELQGLVIGDLERLRTVTGDAPEDAFEAGAVVVFRADGADWDLDPGAQGRATLVVDDADWERTGERHEVAVVIVDVPDQDLSGGVDGIVPLATAHALGIEVSPDATRHTIRLDHPATQADLDRATALMPADGSATVTVALRPPDTTMGLRMLVLVANVVVALSVTAIAVALGESEARPDMRTLLTLGADRRLRRRVTAARGAVLALIAGVLAVPAGLLPAWGVLLNSAWPVALPVPEIVGAIVVLPLMAVLGGLLLGRPLDEWATRRDPTG